jgi:hypothetical protein
MQDAPVSVVRQYSAIMDSTENPYASPAPAKSADVAGRRRYLSDDFDRSQAIVAEGWITEEDFFESQRLNRGPGRFVALFVGLTVIALAGGGLHFLQENLTGFVMISLAIIAVYLLVATLAFPRIAAKRAWRQAMSLREPLRRVITPEVVQMLTPDTNVVLRWNMYSAFRRSERIVLLYLREHPKMFTVVPRHTFASDEDWGRFVALVEEKLPRNKPGLAGG